MLFVTATTPGRAAVRRAMMAAVVLRPTAPVSVTMPFWTWTWTSSGAIHMVRRRTSVMTSWRISASDRMNGRSRSVREMMPSRRPVSPVTSSLFTLFASILFAAAASEASAVMVTGRVFISSWAVPAAALPA
jgi:hypothetical protein